MRWALCTARPMPPVSPCAPWLWSGISTPTGLARAATTRRGARRSTTSMASSITPTGSTTSSSPPPWEGENSEPRNPMESGLFKHRGMHIIVAMHKPQDIDPTRAPGRQCDDALGLLPGVGNRGIKRQAGFIKIIEGNLSFVCLFLSRFKLTLTFGKSSGLSQTLSGFPHTFPSKPCLVGQPFARRDTEALLGCVGEALDHPFERTGLFFDLLLGKCLFVGGEFGWSATAWLIMQTLGTMVFPCRDPGRHSHAMHLIG